MTAAAEKILASFQRDAVEPVRLSFVYRLALAAVAVLMILLPVIYVGLIALAAWGVYWHATENLDFALSGEGRGIILTIFGYGAPLFIGLVLVFFMIKPLFVRREKAAESVTLAPGEEPVLEAFVEKLVRAVGAPMPKAIELDCQVNAAAGFRRGWLSFFGNDLKLIIGLPLVAGTDLQSFGGVLAHEFGHFSQGAGLRLSYIIRSINAWFARVVFERDAWDARLDNAAAGAGDWYLLILINSARGMVWVTRKVLFSLMWVGTAVSSFALRQMEFDADRYEARFAGSDAFGRTCRHLHRLNAGFGETIGLLQHAYRDRRLSSDVPGLARMHAETLPQEQLEAVEEAIAKGKTGLFDSHPCDRERIASAEALATAGIFRSDLPASVLFRDFPALCERVTKHYYVAHQELKVENVRFEDNATLFGESQAERDQDKAFGRVFQGVPHPRRPFHVRPLPGVDLVQAREAFMNLAESSQPSREAFDKALETRDQSLAVAELVRSGYKVTEASTPLPEAETALAMRKAGLEALDAGLATLTGAALARLGEPEQALWMPVFDALAAAEGEMDALEDLTTRLAVLMNNADANGNVPEASFNHMEEIGGLIKTHMKQLRSHLQGVPYPLKHRDPEATLAAALDFEEHVSEVPFVRQGQIAERGMSALRRVAFVGLSRLALEVERQAPVG